MRIARTCAPSILAAALLVASLAACSGGEADAPGLHGVEDGFVGVGVDAETQDVAAPEDPTDIAPDDAAPGQDASAPWDAADAPEPSDAPDTPIGADTKDPPPDPTEALFPPDRLLDIHIVLAPGDLQALRMQTQTVLGVLAPGCLDAPPASPFSWFDASLTVDGEHLAQVAVRKKGLIGSMSAAKPSLRVDINRVVKGQTLHGAKSLTLNNCKQDPSLVRQCLSYRVFAAAGVPSPRCAFARVTLNGEALGVYVNVEPIKKDFLARWFASDDGDLWEGTLSDLRPGWLGTFEKKTHEKDPDTVDLAALATALQDAPDDSLLPAIGPLVDVDAFLSFWAAEVLVAHWDGYAGNTNNYLFYADPTDGDRLRFIPWGADGTLHAAGPKPFPASVMAVGQLARRLYLNPLTRKSYVARLQSLLATAWNEDELLAALDALEAMLTPEVAAADLELFTADLADVRKFIATRRAAIESELAQGPPTWSQPPREPPCMKPGGTVQAAFDTAWQSLTTDNPFIAGSGTFSLVAKGKTFAVAVVGARAGIATEGHEAGRAAFQVFAKSSGADTRILFITADPAALSPGATIPLGAGAEGVIYAIQLGTEAPPQLVGFVSGTLQIEDWAPQSFAPVSATVVGELFTFQ